MTIAIGDAQRYEIILSDFPSFKLYHYATGGSIDKDIWSDAAKTTPLAQPAVADANGQLTFFADGQYRLVFKDSDDVSISGMDYDDFQITADMATTFEANQGTVLPAAAAKNNGHMFLLQDVSKNILGLYVSDGAQYKAMVTFNTAGAQTFDSVATKSHPWRDITHPDYGATAGEASDQSANVQLAIDDIATDGDGMMLVPIGVFQIDSSLDMNNTSIVIEGLGPGSVLRQTADPSAPMFDFDTTNIAHKIVFRNLRIETTVAGSSTAIDCLWPSTSGADSLRNCVFENVYVGPAPASTATAYFTNSIIVSDAKKMDVKDVFLRGHDSLDTVMTGMLLNGYTEDATMNNLRVHHSLTGLETTTNVKNTILSECGFKGQTQGILLGGCEGFKVNQSTFEKEADSTVNWFGIKGDSSDIEITGGNRFKDLGSASGTDKGIYLDTADVGLIDGNVFSTLDTGVETTANTTNIPITNNNMLDSVTTPIVNVNASNPVDGNVPVVWATVASADPIVGSNATNFWRITGNTNFNTIDSSHTREGRNLTWTFTHATGLTIAVTGDIRIPATHTPVTQWDIMEIIYSSADSKWLEKTFSANQ